MITLGIALVLIPLVWFLLPKPVRKVATAFVAVAILAPLGLIALGFAFGEGSPDDVKKAFGYIPQGLQQFSGVFSAPFDGYNVKLPFFNDLNAPLWHQGISYEISGIVFEIAVGPVHLGPSIASLLGAAVFLARVGVTVSLAVLLILSTQWSDILRQASKGGHSA